MKQKLKLAIKKLLSHLPSKLPTTPEQFEKWSNDILELGGYPVNNSFKHALATQLMHAGERETSKPKAFFASTIERSIINQMAFQMMQDIKAEEKAKREATTVEGKEVINVQNQENY